MILGKRPRMAWDPRARIQFGRAKLGGVLNLSLRASGLVHFWLRRHAEHPYDDENDNGRLHGGKVLD